MFGSHRLNGFETVYLFPEWSSKYPLTPPGLVVRTAYGEGGGERSAEFAYRLRIRFRRF